MPDGDFQINSAVRAILSYLDPSPERDGLLATPTRVVESLRELTSGYGQTPEGIMTTFKEEHNQMVIIRDIPMVSLCEHHILPFIGVVHIGYLPKGKVLGLSKFKRLVDIYAKRLQIQERLTDQISAAIEEHLSPRGSMVVIEAEHSCMTIRGVQAPGARTITSAVTGDFLDPTDPARQEFLALIRRSGG